MLQLQQLRGELETARKAREASDSLRETTDRLLVSARARVTQLEAQVAKLEEQVAATFDVTGAVREARSRMEAAIAANRGAGVEVLRLVEDLGRAVLRGDVQCRFRLSLVRRGQSIAAGLGVHKLEPGDYDPETSPLVGVDESEERHGA